MPKKAKRGSIKYAGRGVKAHKTSVQRAARTPISRTEESVAGVSAAPVAARFAGRREFERKPEIASYHYVASDLRRLGVVTALVVVVLVVTTIVVG